MPTKKAFTLIELLVVIALIGILATFIVASFTSAQRKGRDARRKADLDAIRKAFELQKSNTTSSQYYDYTMSNLTANNYIKTLPTDPSTSANYLYTPAPAGVNCGGPTAVCTNYRLRAVLENTNDPEIANSQTRCNLSAPFDTLIGATYPAGTYVVCPP